MSNHFPLKESLMYGWEKAKKFLVFFAPILIVILFINFITGSLDRSIPQDSTFARLIFTILGWAIGSVVSVGIIKISLAIVYDRTPEYSFFNPEPKQILNFFVSSVLFGLAVGLGLILLVIPGIIFALKLQFYPYFLIDKNAGPFEALKRSWNLTRDIKLNLFLFWLCITGINILGILAFFVGLFWSIPTTQIATSYLYKKLESVNRA